MRLHEVAIIGAGPAGIAAAVQLQRYGLDFILLERGEVGGLLLNANLVENYPGFPQGISGPALMERMQAHMRSVGVEAIQTTVMGLAFHQEVFSLHTQEGELNARVLVIASGTKPHRFTDLEIPSNLQSLVFYEVHPLRHVTGKRIAIIGAGDAAFDYALNLGRHNQIAILNRGERRSCLPLLWDRARQTPNIAYHANTRLVGLEARRPGEMILECSTPHGSVRIEADFLIGALGREPQRDFISGDFETASKELVDQGRLHWIGDVQNGLCRQTAIAVGDGVKAAMKIFQRYEENSQ